MLESAPADLLDAAGVGARMRAEGLVHHGIELRFDRAAHRIPLTEPTGGRSIMVYGQQEVVKDLIAARLAAGGTVLFGARDVTVTDIDTDLPVVTFIHNGPVPRGRGEPGGELRGRLAALGRRRPALAARRGIASCRAGHGSAGQPGASGLASVPGLLSGPKNSWSRTRSSHRCHSPWLQPRCSVESR